MTRLPLLLILCTLVACGTGESTTDSATRTEPSATESGVNVSGYARFGVSGKI